MNLRHVNRALRHIHVYLLSSVQLVQSGDRLNTKVDVTSHLKQGNMFEKKTVNDVDLMMVNKKLRKPELRSNKLSTFYKPIFQ